MVQWYYQINIQKLLYFHVSCGTCSCTFTMLYMFWVFSQVISVNQARLNFLNEISQLKIYGGKAFCATMMVRLKLLVLK